MTKPSLGWQSWSPTTPSLLHLPLWDYNPLNKADNTVLSKRSKELKPSISLWCSWHSNGTNIDEKIILAQSSKFRSHTYVPKYILIDDGWCNWGDWQIPSPVKFPQKIKSLTSKLKKNGFKTGLWIAPFLVSPDSQLLDLHPEWLIKNRDSSLFNGFTSYPLIKSLTPKYLLDFSRPDVMEYIIKCIDTIIEDWGVSLLKLDHLYAPYFAPDSDIANQASTAITLIFQHIQIKHPSVYTIACGCPFKDAQNNVDSIRISKDINSPQLKSYRCINYLLYIVRKKLKNQKIIIARRLSPLPFGIDPDAAINQKDAKEYFKLWESGIIQVFGLGYNL